MLVSRRLAELYKVGVGDTIELMNDVGDSCHVAIAGVFENYCEHYIFVDANYYKSIFGTGVDDSAFFIRSNGVPASTLEAAFAGTEGYLVCEDLSVDKVFLRDASSALTLVVILCSFLSALLAVMVLLNLCVMFVNAKARELAIMRVNGFTRRETKAYIYRDNIVLTVIGLILGVICGVALAAITIQGVEGATHIPRDPQWGAIILACIINALFMLVITIVALRKIDKLNLTQVSGN